MSLRICTFCSIISLLFLLGCYTKQGHFYQIQKGDTAHRIAHKHGISVKQIQKANPQKDLDFIIAGQQLWVPGGIKKGDQQVMRTIAQQTPMGSKVKTSISSSKPVTQSRPVTKNTLKFDWPYAGKVISTFGMKDLKMHNGIDIEIPSAEFIKASQQGKVAYVGDDIQGYGQTIILQHDEHLFSVYAYLGKTLVQKGQTVTRQQNIAKPVIQKDSSFFHFEIRKIKTALDPLSFLEKG